LWEFLSDGHQVEMAPVLLDYLAEVGGASVAQRFKIRFVLADACQSGMPTSSADFVWGDDAWCYVVEVRVKPLRRGDALERWSGRIAPTRALFVVTPSTLSAWSGVRAWTFPITRFSLSTRNDATTGIGSHRLFGGAK
jgi:hypothetical protein